MYGCLLGYTSIAAEMGDADLKALVEHIAAESLPVVEDPGILSPRAFIDEVLHERFPNPAIPDTPQRIAADTSQKLPVRYGGTLRRYARQSEQALAGLEFAPLVFAGWCRYLLGVDDRGNAMPVSPDPMLPQLQAHLKGIEVGRPDSLAGQLRPILSNAALFGLICMQQAWGRGQKRCSGTCWPARGRCGPPCTAIVHVNSHNRNRGFCSALQTAAGREA